MSELSKIDVKAMPRRSRRLRVARDHDGLPRWRRHVQFTIVAGDFMDLDGGQVSMASPIGRGLLGAGEGEEVTVISLPVGERRQPREEAGDAPAAGGRRGTEQGLSVP
jgi:uncharacterized membrane-anchored protein